MAKTPNAKGQGSYVKGNLSFFGKLTVQIGGLTLNLSRIMSYLDAFCVDG